MATPKSGRDDANSSFADDHGHNADPSGAPPTYATFSPVTLSATTPSRSSRQSTILVHQKSPLLLATPPQITRALAYSHPFLLPLNKAAGLLSWTTGDPWESFLVVCVFWAAVLYGDVIVRTAGPLVLVLGLMLAMYGRRYSPLSSSGWTEPGGKDGGDAAGPARGSHHQGGAGGKGTQSRHQRTDSEATNTRHQKTLDEMVETLKEFTGRCNVLLGPALELTDFLSTQRTPTSATTRPALTALLIRILFCTPFWYALTLSPWRIISSRRVVLLVGTLLLTWHARVMRVARAILWRSATVRRTVALVTGLEFDKPTGAAARTGKDTSSSATTEAVSGPVSSVHRLPEDEAVTATADGPVPKVSRKTDSELTRALRHRSHRHGNNATGRDAGVKFTFIIYENQRRWVGLGWTQSLFAYERGAWTDEHNNPVPAKDDFELPDVEDGSNMRWRWVAGSRWKVDGVSDDGAKEVDYDGEAGQNGWIYYDNKWQNGRRGSDGWGRWTRRRKWYRDAELVEASELEDDDEDSSSTPTATANASTPDLTSPRYNTASEKMVSPTQSTPNLPLRSPLAEEASKAPSEKSYDGAPQQESLSSSLSSSAGSRTSFFRKQLMRKSATQSSATTGSSATSTTAVEEKDKKGANEGEAGEEEKDEKKKKRERRLSETTQSEDEGEVDEVSRRVDLALQSQGQGGGGKWGIGDEARMSLE